MKRSFYLKLKLKHQKKRREAEHVSRFHTSSASWSNWSTYLFGKRTVPLLKVSRKWILLKQLLRKLEEDSRHQQQQKPGKQRKEAAAKGEKDRKREREMEWESEERERGWYSRRLTLPDSLWMNEWMNNWAAEGGRRSTTLSTSLFNPTLLKADRRPPWSHLQPPNALILLLFRAAGRITGHSVIMKGSIVGPASTHQHPESKTLQHFCPLCCWTISSCEYLQLNPLPGLSTAWNLKHEHHKTLMFIHADCRL